MVLENVIAYVIVLGLPFWLVAEEILHRFASRPASRSGVAPSTAQTGLEHSWVS